MRIRIMQAADRELILALSKRFHGEAVQSGLPFEEEVAAAYFDQVIAGIGQGTQCGFHAESAGGMPAGFFIGELARYPFSRRLIAQDKLFYVAPEYRGSSAAVKLLRVFDRWARKRGACQLYISERAAVNSKAFARLMRHTGFDIIGGNYGKWLLADSPVNGSAPRVR